MIKHEDEVLLKPKTYFIVTKELYAEDDFYYLEEGSVVTF